MTKVFSFFRLLSWAIIASVCFQGSAHSGFLKSVSGGWAEVGKGFDTQFMLSAKHVNPLNCQVEMSLIGSRGDKLCHPIRIPVLNAVFIEKRNFAQTSAVGGYRLSQPFFRFGPHPFQNSRKLVQTTDKVEYRASFDTDRPSGRLARVFQIQGDRNLGSAALERSVFQMHVSSYLSFTDFLCNVCGFNSSVSGSNCRVGSFSGFMQRPDQSTRTDSDQDGLYEGIKGHVLRGLVHPLLSSQIVQFALLGTLFSGLTGISLAIGFDDFNADRRRLVVGRGLGGLFGVLTIVCLCFLAVAHFG